MNKISKYKICGWLNATPCAKLVYLVLDDLADENGDVTVSQRKISDALRISRSAIRRNIRRLRDGGYITVQEQYHDDGGRAANKYHIK